VIADISYAKELVFACLRVKETYCDFFFSRDGSLRVHITLSEAYFSSLGYSQIVYLHSVGVGNFLNYELRYPISSLKYAVRFAMISKYDLDFSGVIRIYYTTAHCYSHLDSHTTTCS